MRKIFFLAFLLGYFIKQLNAQVNLQTGSATFSLPMFNWQDDKSRLNSIVALNYNSGNGLKADEVASNIGQGWNLLAGGVITRMQVGEPDDQKPYFDDQIHADHTEGIGDITKYPAGYLYNDDDVYTKGCPIALTKYPLFGDKNHIYKQHNKISIDRELDYFSFQFNGHSGLFVLGKTNNNQCLLLGDSKLKVSFEQTDNMIYQGQGIRTTISVFTIKDENGLIYKFGKYWGDQSTTYGLTKVLKTSYCDANQIQPLTQPTFKKDGVYHEGSFEDTRLINPYIINSWYLTEIEDPFTHRTISFTYSVRNINCSAGTNISYYRDDKKDYSIITHKRSIIQIPEIASITFPDKLGEIPGHVVSFNYGNERIDLNGDYALASVNITYQGRYLSKYLLTTSYFILNRYGTPISDYEKSVARLCLQSVKKTGVDLKADDPPYIFDYYTGSNDADDFVPPAFSPFKDVWGFYNGNFSHNGDNQSIQNTKKTINQLSNNDLKGLCFFLWKDGVNFFNAKPGYAKNGLLKQIIYPTGGTLTYEYEQNTGKIENTDDNSVHTVGGIHVSTTKLTDGGYSNGCNNPIITQYKYVLDNGNEPSLWGLQMPDNSTVINNHYAPEYRDYKLSFPFGQCYYHYQYPGILSRDDEITLSGHQQFMLDLSQVLNVVSIVMQVMDVVNLCLDATPASIIAVIIDVIGGLYTLVSTCFSDPSEDNSSTAYYNTDLNNSNPLPVQFKRVEVVQNTGDIGKTVEEFTSSGDYAIWEPENKDFSMKQRFAYWAYGLPKITTVFNVNGEKVKEIQNDYDFTSENVKRDFCYNEESKSLTIYCPAKSCKCEVLKSSSQRYTDWSNPLLYDAEASYKTSTVNDVLSVDPYMLYTGRVNLADVHERIYKPDNSNQYMETVTHYDYDENSFHFSNFLDISKITTTQSNGDINYKTIKYNGDYAGGALNLLNDNNIFSTPVEAVNSFRKNGSGDELYLNEKVTEFAQLANGDIKPSRILEQRFNQPQSSMYFYAGPELPNPVYKETQTFTYDRLSNLTGMKDEGNHTVTNIYDYNDKYIVASVINADANIDKRAYTSFEAESLGGWTAERSLNYVRDRAITGNISLNLSENTLSADINSEKSYILSFWAESEVSIDGRANLIKRAPTINGFTYYEYNIERGTTRVILSGNSIIDELRLYPSTARMRTVTYDPLIGKTSECDENNRITYYEYDESARLKFIKDENKNVIKMYEYNTVTKQNGCPGIYYNHLISETFTKNNCSSNETGSEVTYTVPANKYSSTISQADADMQAENELLTQGQVYANSNGTCIQNYYNNGKSKDFMTEACAAGTIGGPVTYTVPAHKYSGTSQAEVDEREQDEIDANGQAYANTHPNCIYSTEADWQSNFPNQVQCDVNGHTLLLQTDMNPNSSSYGDTQWTDIGNTGECPIQGGCGICNRDFQKCINNNCEAGTIVYTSSYHDSQNNVWYCTYHYEFSDGTTKGPFTKQTSSDCMHW